MSGLPQISMVATLVADPELRFTKDGKAIAKMRLASNDRRRDESGEWRTVATTFLDATLFGKKAEAAADSLSKGQLVLVQGRLAQREWTTEDGAKRSAYEVTVDEVGSVVLASSGNASGTRGDLGS